MLRSGIVPPLTLTAPESLQYHPVAPAAGVATVLVPPTSDDAGSSAFRTC